MDGDGDAAFAGAVELGDDEAVERAGFVEFLGLLECVGAGGGIDDEQVRCGAVSSCLARVRRIFPSSSIRLWRVWMRPAVSQMRNWAFVGDGFLMGVEADGRRIGVGISGDDRDVEALAPAFELLDGGGAEGVGGGEHDACGCGS